MESQDTFAKQLETIAADPTSTIFVVVGARDGLGAVKHLWEGMKERTDNARLLAFEASKTWWRVANQTWKDVSGGPTVVWARVADHMMTEEMVREHSSFERIKDYFEMHYKQDAFDFKAAPLVRLRRCDVAVLDGGVFCGENDWHALSPLSPKVVCLTGMKTIKNDTNYLKMLVYGWQLVWKSEEGDGYAILKRPEGMKETETGNSSEV